MWRDHWHIVAIRTSTYKFIWDSRHPDHPELYDLRADPGERTNVVAEQPDLARYFQSRVDEHLRRVAESADTGSVSEPELEAEMIRRLRDLGYVE
jgi:arylsulfatase A-like enzyme